jgi:sugar phosphate isomerase/epimerase
MFAGTRQGTPLVDRLAPAKAAGFTAISVWPGDLAGVDRAVVADAVAQQGLVVTEMESIAHWLPSHASSCSPWAEAVRHATPERILQMAKDVGARTVSVVELLGEEWRPAALAQAFAELCDRAAEQGMNVAVEHLPVGAVRDFARARELVERADRPNAGIMVDAWHFFRSGSSLDELAKCPGSLILSVQLNDAAAEPEPDLNVGMMHRRLPGEGALDLRGFLQALAATGTTAPVGIETFLPELDALETAEAFRRCAAALDYCLEFTK